MENRRKPVVEGAIADQPASQKHAADAARNEPSSKRYKAFGTYPHIMKVLSKPSDALIANPVDLQKTILNSYVCQLARKIQTEGANLSQIMQTIEGNISEWSSRKDADAKGYAQLYSDQYNRLRPLASDRMKERNDLITEIKSLVDFKDEKFKNLSKEKTPADVFNAIQQKADALSTKLNGLIEREKATQLELATLQRQSRAVSQKVVSDISQTPQPGSS